MCNILTHVSILQNNPLLAVVGPVGAGKVPVDGSCMTFKTNHVFHCLCTAVQFTAMLTEGATSNERQCDTER